MKLLVKILEIYNGWKNYIFRTIEIERLSKERMKVCRPCEYYKFKVCVKCSCPLAGKSRSPKAKCLKNKWIR